MIYLDNSATTRPCKEAVEAMTAALTEGWANPSALYDFGIDAARQLRIARNKVAAALGAELDRVYFTSGGTEADNWAIFGAAKRFGKSGCLCGVCICDSDGGRGNLFADGNGTGRAHIACAYKRISFH